MPILRREVLRRLGTSIIGGATVSCLGNVSLKRASLPAWGMDQPRKPVLLDHNENAYGPSEQVHAALRNAAAQSSRYQRAEYELLVAKLAALHKVRPEQILLGCGSSEILKQAAANFLGLGKKLVQAVPTYPALGKFALANGAKVVEVPLNKRFQHDLAAMLTRAGDFASLIYICNPNNPTGTLTPRADIDGFLKRIPDTTVVLIDEAYHHFVTPTSSYASFVDYPSDNPRVVACRTFSTIYGLAGMRIGYAVGTSETISRLSLGRLPDGVSTPSAIAAAAAVDDFEFVQRAIRRNANDRQEFVNRINGAMLRSLDSHTNFVFFNPMRPVDIVVAHLKGHNVIVAPPIPAMKEYLRVSLGTPAEMQEFWRVMDLLPAVGKMAM